MMNPYLVPIIMTQFLPLAFMVGILLPQNKGISTGEPYGKFLFVCVIITIMGYAALFAGLS